MQSDSFQEVPLSQLSPHAPQNLVIFKHWLSLLGNSRIPLWGAFDPLDIAEALTNCLIVRIEEDDLYKVQMMGSALVERFGEDTTGRHLFEIYEGNQRDLSLLRLKLIRKRPAALRILSRLETASQALVHIEILGLPFSDADGAINHILFSTHSTPLDNMDSASAVVSLPRRRFLEGEFAQL